MGENAHVKLVRTSNWVYRLRKFGVFVDRLKVGSIANDEEFDFNLAPGHHAIVLKVSWCKSETVEVDVVADQQIELECGTRLRIAQFIVLSFLAVFGNVFVHSIPVVGAVLLLAAFIFGAKLTYDTFQPGKFLYLCQVVECSEN